MAVIISNIVGQDLGKRISKKFGCNLIAAQEIIYNNHELEVVIKDLDPTEQEIYILHLFAGGSANDSLFSLIQMIEATYHQSAAEINLVMPYLLYARHDRRFSSYHSFGMHSLSRLINNLPVKRMIVCDMHNPENEDLFNTRVDNILPSKLMNSLVRDKLIILPDHGAKTRYKINSNQVAYCQKSRIGNQIELSLNEDVAGQNCLIIDDMIDSGQTMIQTAAMLKSKGAIMVEAYATHALLNNDFSKRYLSSGISKLYVTNSIYHQQMMAGIEVLDIADLIVEAV